ncbi:Uncharacterised protein [Brucella anthropi]|nr:Uncharacterised protein [Brucella anthropi]
MIFSFEAHSNKAFRRRRFQINHFTILRFKKGFWQGFNMLPLKLSDAAAQFRGNAFCFQDVIQFTTNGFKISPDSGQLGERCAARNCVNDLTEAKEHFFQTLTKLASFFGPLRQKSTRYLFARLILRREDASALSDRREFSLQ